MKAEWAPQRLSQGNKQTEVEKDRIEEMKQTTLNACVVGREMQGVDQSKKTERTHLLSKKVNWQ